MKGRGCRLVPGKMYLLGGTEKILVNVETDGQECAYCEVFWFRFGEQLSPLTSDTNSKGNNCISRDKVWGKKVGGGDHL